MPYSTAAKNIMLDAIDEAVAAGMKYMSLHTAWPGGAGSNEVSGGSPAYARKAAVWAAASSASKAAASATFDVPASTTVGFFGVWDAVTAGTYLGCGILGGSSTPKVFTADATTDTITSPGHGLTAGTSVVFIATAGSLPGGITEGTVYYVIASGLTTDAFKVSATSGGSTVDITAAGVGIASAIVRETFAGQGTYALNPATVDLLL